ncbi:MULTISPECIES: transporter substrate-binding domain-containing protein [Inquilinus]|uniref:ABC-type amino acid transport substrate-binding protein n=1 Tax=Inquilinus ginsengisoli TaxID=363840 RepID=A0ABU1JQN1_9PROT|nr:transporter substrate-binding domain-containing protein [Inquilinus ginsengisoli]MDR6290622.1 ABC-type amino acid transport substrate-binding protein [Inquilinus ginsengisoli]
MPSRQAAASPPDPAGQAVGIGFRKDSPLVAPANVQLAAMKANGRYQALVTKWFGS